MHAVFRRSLTGGTLVVVAIALSVIVLVQPALWARSLGTVIALAAVAGMTELLGRRGHPVAASWWMLLGIILIIATNALHAGGITSPGVRSLLVCVLIAGVLIGERAAIGVAVISSAIGLALALMERGGVLPASSVVYDPLAQWVLLSLYLGVTVVLVRFFARSAEASFHREAEAVFGARQASEQLDAVMTASGIGVWSYHAGPDLYVGDARVHEIMGSAGDPAVPIPAAAWRAQVVPDDLPALVAMLTRLSRQGGSETQSLRILTPSGDARHLDITCTGTRTTSGGGYEVTGLVHDRTAEHRAEAARAEATTALGERVMELTLLHAASRLLRSGRPLDDALLADLVALIPPAFQYPERTVAHIRCGDLAASTPRWGDTRARLEQRLACGTPSGEIVIGLVDEDAELSDTFLPEERELVASLAEMLESFIAREHAEQLHASLEDQLRQSQKMEALGTLAGGIAHDFNNILTAIGANITLARSEAAPDDPIRDPLDQIDRAATRATELVRRILLFSRRQESEMRLTHLGPIVQEVAELLQASTPAHIQVLVRQAADLPPLRADESQLHQALVNLGTNAVHAMGEREGRVAFEVDHRTIRDDPDGPTALAPGSYLSLVVRDSGVGIDPVIRDRLFDPFFTTKGSAGTGLGLAVVHGVVQAHGGQISVDSVVGEGTAFTLLLPAEATTPPVAPMGEQVLERGRGERVLFVDDEEAIVYVMVKMLRGIGFACEGFTSPLEALQAFRTTPHAFDAVVTDFSMPMMTGTLLARELQRIRPGIPVVVLSGFTADEIATGSGTGVDTVIPKPVSIVELSHALATMLDRPVVTDAASPPGSAPR
ncbi:MAG: ATP-binding protein [Gemmatimonadales bacterium]|nr:ATP-binding protein [Gemmatimonadales bacterium]